MKWPGGTSAQSSARSPPGTSNGLFVKLQACNAQDQITTSIQIEEAAAFDETHVVALWH